MVFHILAACEAHKFSLYKNRHDLIVVEIAKMIMKRFNVKGFLRMDNSRVSVDPVIITGNGIRITVDLAMLMDEVIAARRPDIVVSNEQEKWIEVACAIDSLLEEGEKEKHSKYLPLAADMAKVNSAKVVIYPIVVGCLGCFSNARNELKQCKSICSKDVDQLMIELKH